jgi:hypothetical protein
MKKSRNQAQSARNEHLPQVEPKRLLRSNIKLTKTAPKRFSKFIPGTSALYYVKRIRNLKASVFYRVKLLETLVRLIVTDILKYCKSYDCNMESVEAFLV